MRRHGRGLHHAAARAAIAQAQGIDYLSSTQRHRRVDHHRDAAPQLRRQPRADRDQHAGQLGAQPAAAAGAAAGADRADRPDHRRDVHGLLQRRAADQQRHRLSRARRQAQARFDRGRADRRDPRRAPVRAARLARSDAAGRARRHRGRRVHRARQRTTISPRSARPRARWSAST